MALSKNHKAIWKPASETRERRHERLAARRVRQHGLRAGVIQANLLWSASIDAKTKQPKVKLFPGRPRRLSRYVPHQGKREVRAAPTADGRGRRRARRLTSTADTLQLTTPGCMSQRSPGARTMLHRFTSPDGTIDRLALFDGFVTRARYGIRTSPDFTMEEHMAEAWERVLDEAKGEKSAYAFSRGRGPTMRIIRGELFGVQFDPVDPVAKRRARLLRFVSLMDDSDPYGKFTPRLGTTKMRWECLTDDALEDISADIVKDFWWRKKQARENREAVARRDAIRAERAEAVPA